MAVLLGDCVYVNDTEVDSVSDSVFVAVLDAEAELDRMVEAERVSVKVFVGVAEAEAVLDCEAVAVTVGV